MGVNGKGFNTVNTEIKMEGVREYAEGYDVFLYNTPNNRTTIQAFNEGGYNSTTVDLLDVLEWCGKHCPNLLIDTLNKGAYTIPSKAFCVLETSVEVGTSKLLDKVFTSDEGAKKYIKKCIEDNIDTAYPMEYSIKESTIEEILKSTQEERFGVFFGRFQPFHYGHKQDIEYIRRLGYTPIVVICSAQEEGTDKNPYCADTRERMIKKGLNFGFNTYHVTTLEDSLGDDANWLKRLQECVEEITKGREYAYFVHNKESEKGKYQSLKESEFISDKIQGTKFDLSKTKTCNVCATDIRNDPVGFKDKVPQGVWEIMAKY